MNTSILPNRFKANCSACCGICCVALPFDASQGFAFDKPAHTPCVNLQSDFRCSIYDRRAISGFPSCGAYDCYGAGQQVTRLFKNATWRDSAELATQMFGAFRQLRTLHELLAMLAISIQRANSENSRGKLKNKLQELEIICDEMPAILAENIANIRHEVRVLLRECVTDQLLSARPNTVNC
jgi:hypothetical protein